MQHHPLWHSEQNPDAPPQHIYHPPQQPNSHTSQYQTRPMLVPNTQGMVAPVSRTAPLAHRRQIKKITQRRDDLPKDHEKGYRSASVMEAHYSKRDERYAQERERPEYKRQDSIHSDASSSRTYSQSQAYSMPMSTFASGNPRYALASSSKYQTDGFSPNLDLAPSPKYTLRMRQEPIAARACGFGERDRRVIDPPPILQMSIDSPTSSPEEITAMIRNPYTVVHCVLWDPVTNKDDTAMPSTADKRQQRRLMGTLVASPFVGLDEHKVEGCFFTFPDLSVRTPGTYTLQFSLVALDPKRMTEGSSEQIRSKVMSSPFTVYNAKDFSGMRASTELTKTLKQQGCLISVKKGNTKNNGGSNARDDDDDDDEDDDDEEDKRGKRPRH